MRPLELLFRSSAWLSLLGWAAAQCLAARPRAARGASSLGLSMLAVHTALAFEIRYAWSHELAARETARETQALFGWSSGAEVFVNYLFLLVWAAEAAWWWLSSETYRRRPRALTRAVRGFFLLMFASGAVVFVRGPLRLLGAAAILAAVWAWYRGERPRTPTPNV